MKGWVSLVGWPVVDGFTHIVVTRRLQAERRTGSVCRQKTGFPPTVLRNQPTCMLQSSIPGAPSLRLSLHGVSKSSNTPLGKQLVGRPLQSCLHWNMSKCRPEILSTTRSFMLSIIWLRRGHSRRGLVLDWSATLATVLGQYDRSVMSVHVFLCLLCF